MSENAENNGNIRDANGRFLPGNPGSPGRPKGKTMKEFAREFLLNMTDAEKIEWLKSVPPGKLWEMAEGMARQEVEQSGSINVIEYGKSSTNIPATTLAEGSADESKEIQ